MRKILFATSLLLCAVVMQAQQHPTTGCYWEWMNGNISKEGITKDLEYMKAAGIESAFIFDTWVGVERGSVDYGSREWIEAVKHACKEAQRLGIVLGIHNSPGYTAMGGPWIRPEESMKQLTWSVSSKKNPPTPSHKMGFYRDIKTFRTTCADEMQDIRQRLEKDESVVITLQKEKPLVGFNLWRGEREKPLDAFDGPRDYAPRLKVETSKDGKNWTEVGTASGRPLFAHDIPIYFKCDATPCRYVRLTSNRGTNLDRIELLTALHSGTTYRRVGYTTTGQMVTAASESGIGLEVDKLSRQGVEAHFDRFLGPLFDGSIERPFFVSRYGHSAGRPVIGCEFGTAYPGDADIPAVLSNFRDDINKVCDAGVNYFVLHCVAHQDRDDRPMTMGPFGTRFDRLHANADSVRAITDYIRQRVALQQHRVSWDFQRPISDDGSSGGYFLRLPRGQEQVKAVLYCHQNMTEEVLFRSKMFSSKMDSLGVAMAFVQQGSQNWDLSVKDANGQTCQEHFEQIMQELARETEHPELATCPIIPFGHSAQATFPWNFAAWNPDRTLCIISYHGDAPRTNLCGYGRANVEWGRTRNIDSIPGLMIEGEYEWWEARVRPALAFRMMYPDSRISFLCDAGKGHFDLSEQTQDYIARFIAKALADPRPKGGVYYSRWQEDGTESQDPHDQFWYQDDEMVALTRARYKESLGKQMQYVSASIGGQLIKFNPASHIKLNITIDTAEFTIEPVFTDSTRNAMSSEHANVRPRVVLISGAALQTGEYTFRYAPDYFGFDPKRLWDGITLSIEADGDGTYKSAVQELNIQMKR